MAFIPVPLVASFEMVYSYDGEICENVLNCAVSDPGDVAVLEDVAAVLVAWYGTERNAGEPVTLSLNKIICTDQSDQFGPRIEYTTGLPLVGQDSGNAQLPNNVTAVISLKTPKRGRSYRGRIYHIGIKENQVEENTLNATMVTRLTNVYGALLGDLLSNATPLVVVSRFTNNAPRIQGTWEEVISFSVDPTVDSQRRRLPGRGR